MAPKSIKLPEDRENIKEATITILGNANSGKSSLVGILSNPNLWPLIDEYTDAENTTLGIPEEILDDGNGRSRREIMQFIHEQKTGRTSSITYNYMLINRGYKIISIVDLAGHEAYLKTTIRGVTSSYPDYGFVCIEKSITRITKEHMQILYILNIPFSIIMTKIDIMPEDKLKENLKNVFKLMKKLNKTPFIIKKREDLNVIKNCHENICPIFLLSNKSGIGFDKLLLFINIINKKETKIIPNNYVIDAIYTVSGFGLVVSGISGIEVKKGEEMFLGPFMKGDSYEFIKAKVRTIHDDYRNFVDVLPRGVRGCLCLKIDNKYRNKLKSGFVLAHKPDDIKPLKTFKAKIYIFNGTYCTIKEGYNAYVNTGIIRGGVKFNKIAQDKTQYIRAGSVSIAELEFLKNAYCLSPGEIFIFREGLTIGYGEVL